MLSDLSPKALLSKILSNPYFDEKEKVVLASAVAEFLDDKSDVDDLEGRVMYHLRALKNAVLAYVNEEDDGLEDLIEEYIYRIEEEFELFRKEG